MKSCPVCGTQFPDDAAYCPLCGTSVPVEGGTDVLNDNVTDNTFYDTASEFVPGAPAESEGTDVLGGDFAPNVPVTPVTPEVPNNDFGSVPIAPEVPDNSFGGTDVLNDNTVEIPDSGFGGTDVLDDNFGYGGESGTDVLGGDFGGYNGGGTDVGTDVLGENYGADNGTDVLGGNYGADSGTDTGFSGIPGFDFGGMQNGPVQPAPAEKKSKGKLPIIIGVVAAVVVLIIAGSVTAYLISHRTDTADDITTVPANSVLTTSPDSQPGADTPSTFDNGDITTTVHTDGYSATYWNNDTVDYSGLCIVSAFTYNIKYERFGYGFNIYDEDGKDVTKYAVDTVCRQLGDGNEWEWVVDLAEDMPAGSYTIKFRFTEHNEDKTKSESKDYEVDFTIA